jgi:hypothetical protein
MGQFLKRKRMQVWIACLAILLNALAPSLSHALMTGPSNMMEICSAAGTRWMAVDLAADASTGSSTDTALHHAQHCPFCVTHADLLDLPQSASFAVDGGHDLFPALFYRSPTPLFSWSAANPRAPPADHC